MYEHDLPTAPGALLGYRKDGRPIRLIAGARQAEGEGGRRTLLDTGQPPAGPGQPAGNGQTPPPAGQNPPPGEPPAGQDPGQPAGRPAGQPGQPAGQPGQPAGEPPGQPPAASVDELPEWAQRLIRDTRAEAATHRTRAKERDDQLAALQQQSQAQLDGIAKALGLKPEEATPEQIMAERDAERARADTERTAARQAQVELAVFRAAEAAEANGNALLDSRAFVRTLDGLDPAADDFAEKVKGAIDRAVEANPAVFRKAAAPPAPPLTPPAAPAAPAVPKSGGEFTGPPQSPRQLTAEDAASMTPSQVAKAIDDGLFAAAGFGQRRASRR